MRKKARINPHVNVSRKLTSSIRHTKQCEFNVSIGSLAVVIVVILLKVHEILKLFAESGITYM